MTTRQARATGTTFGGLVRGEANFDWIARAYRFLEYAALGPLLQRTRTHFLNELPGCRRALVFGDGDGRFLAELLRRNGSVTVEAVDSSGEMLRLLGKRCRAVAGKVGGGGGRVRLHHESALRYVPESAADLVVSHFFFDCLLQAELEGLIGRVARTLAPGALWVVSEFRIPGGVVRWPSLVYIRLLYFAFRVLTGLRVTALPEYGLALERAGFVRVGCARRLFGLLSSELWRLEG